MGCDIEKLAHVILKTVEMFVEGYEEDWHPAEVLASMELAKMELLAGTYQASGFVVMEPGVDAKQQAEFLGELTIEEPDAEEEEDEDE